MSDETKSFRLILPIEVFAEWRRFYPGHGIRQDFLRRVVNLMIYRAKLRHGLPTDRPLLMPAGCEEGTFEDAIEMLLDKHRED